MSEANGPERTGVVCLGASAGGLRSLEAILSRIPASFPWPILVSQHMQREHASLMPEILSRATKLIVREASADEAPLPGYVYTCPSDFELGLSPEGRLTLRPPVEGRPQRIDHLFATASVARPGLVVAVVLSGTGNDGATGSLVVKLNGGTVIAESDETAQQSAMPRAAVKSGSVDATRSADAIPPLLVQLAEGGLEAMTHAMRREVAEIARTLAESSGTDFTRYRPETLRRRMDKRRALAGSASLAAYHALLKRDAGERAALAKSLLLLVTEFFRDPSAWETLASEVLPGLAERARSGDTIRVWCAGCASGEEAYSIAIALAESGAPLDRVRILGTDLDPDSLAFASLGAYDAARCENVGAERLARFFEPFEGGFRARAEVRGAVEFRVHDLTRDPPPPEAPFDVIICRNVLIYFDDSLQEHVLAGFERAFAPGGVLFLGRSTAIPSHSSTFEPIARPMRIFRSRRAGAAATPIAGAPALDSLGSGASRAPDATAQVDAVLVEDSSAVILVVDSSWRVALANRRARDATSSDVVGKSLLDVFPRWQGSPVHDALRATMATGRSVRVRGVPVGGAFVDLTLDALPEAAERKLILVAYPAPAPRAPPLSGSAERDDQEVLRKDLAATNDELQTANEELAAANEELQATNEELASLNEEFLSTNQTLASSNAEMHASADESRPTADLLHAILSSREDAIVACDAMRRVVFATPRAARLLGPEPPALGKRLDARALGIDDATMDAWFEESARAAGPVLREVPATGGTLRVSVEAIRGPGARALGWVLTWAALPNMQEAKQE